MLDSDDEFTVTDVARSMKRLGFSEQEIYDTLTGTGISGSETQLLLDRIEADFEDAELESRVSRLAKEVEEIFDRKLVEIKVDLESKLRILERNLKSVAAGVEGLEDRVTELQGIYANVSSKEKNKTL